MNYDEMRGKQGANMLNHVATLAGQDPAENENPHFNAMPASVVPCATWAMCWCTAVVLAALCLSSFLARDGLTLAMLPSAFVLVFFALCFLHIFIMEDDLSGLQAPSEPRTSAQKGVLGDHLDSAY